MFSKYFLSLLAALILCSLLHAQTIYLLKYDYSDDDGKTDYRAFLVRNDDGTGFIRVSFVDSATGQQHLIDMDMEESYERNEKTKAVDSSILYFEGENAKVLKGDPKETYDPDIFEFHKAADGYYEPYDVFCYDEKDEEQDGNFNEIQLLDEKDLTKDFILEFFTKDEDVYKDLFETTTRDLTGDQKAAVLHLIIVANTNDPSIGPTCALDRDRTKETFSNLAEFMKIGFDVKTIYGDDYNIDNVKNAVTSLNPSSKDIVVFYYSGHGFSKTDNLKYPYIELRAKEFQGLDDNSLNIEDVYNQLKSKGARFTLVYSDCCNTLPGTPPVISGVFATTRSSNLGWSLNNCAQLFFPDKPTAILMAAATKGEQSAGNMQYGGFFTFNFKSSLTNYLSPLQDYSKVSWQNIISDAQQITAGKANHTMCGDIRCSEHPIYQIQ